MRIAHVDSEHTWRGGQAQVMALLTGLAARGHANQLHCPEGPLAGRARAAGLVVHPFRARSDLDVSAAWTLARSWRDHPPDLVHLHSARAHAVGSWAARWAGGLPVVVSRRVDFEVAASPWSAFKYRHGVDRYLCISLGVRRVLERAGVAASRLRLVPSGIDLERWRNLPDSRGLRAELGLAPDVPVVGSLAALAPHKDHANLLAAAARLHQGLPQVRWVVFGEGELRSDLEAERSRLGLDGIVLFPGFTSRVAEAMALLDVFVLSSYLEGLGTSVLDAQAAGIPVVATAVGGVPEMIEDGVNGWLVPLSDPVALATAVEQAIGDRSGAERRARRARETVKRFSIANTVALTEACYEEVLAERGRTVSSPA